MLGSAFAFGQFASKDQQQQQKSPPPSVPWQSSYYAQSVSAKDKDGNNIIDDGKQQAQAASSGQPQRECKMVMFEGRMVSAAAADDGAQKQQKHIAAAAVVYAESVYEDCVMNDAVWHHAQQTQKPKTAEEPKSILQNYAAPEIPSQQQKKSSSVSNSAANATPTPSALQTQPCFDQKDTQLMRRAGYSILDYIHTSPFSRIYRVNDNNGVEFIAKVETTDEQKKTLGLEAKVYLDCSDERGFPKMYNRVEVNGHKAIILEKLGANLAQIRKVMPNQRLPLQDALKVALKTFCRIWSLHCRGWLHRDIKASNFVVGYGEYDEQIYIVDFGLARPICDQFRPAGNCPIVGTALYHAIAIHNRVDYRAKDDLESWYYMCAELISGSLPWSTVPKEIMCDYKIFCRKAGRRLLTGCFPPEFDTILTIIDNSINSVNYFQISALITAAIAKLDERLQAEPYSWIRDPSIHHRALAQY